MGMTENLLSTTQWVITALLFAVILLAAVRSVDWHKLRQDTSLQHTFWRCRGAWVLWQLRAGISPGLSIHVFGVTLVTLMLGWGLAVLAGLLALAITVITGREPLIMFAANGLITVMVPALVSYAIMLWGRHRDFNNFFAYIFVCGFLVRPLRWRWPAW